MKTLFLLLFCPLLLISSNLKSNNGSDDPEVLNGSTRIYCVPELLDITKEWVDEFVEFHPKVNIKIVVVTESSMEWVMDKSGSICIVSANYIDQAAFEQWSIGIGRDVLLPIVNIGNPYLMQIQEAGISQEVMGNLIEDPEMRSWKAITSVGGNTPINYYVTEEGASTDLLSTYLSLEQSKIDGIKVENEEALVAAVGSDPYAFGFCSYKNIMDPTGKGLRPNISILPVDKNGNGKIDYIEQIYSNQIDLMRGIWIGKYPGALVNSIYTVSHEKPTEAIELTFLKWVLSDGQQQLSMAGYGGLSLSEQVTKMSLLEDSPIEISKLGMQNAYTGRTIFIILISAVLLVMVVVFTRRYGFHRYNKDIAIISEDSVFDQNSLRSPGGIYYDKSHTWAFMEQNGRVKVGIDDFLQHITGPITAIKLKKVGENISKGDLVLSIIQKGKQISLYSPVSGTIEEQNVALNTHPSKINSSPYTDGWVYMIKPVNWLWDAQSLLFGLCYSEWLKGEFTRFKDFLATFVKPKNFSYTQAVLQDGGEIKENILSELGPEGWEDFQRNFIDNSR